MRLRFLILPCVSALVGIGCAADATGGGSGALTPHAVDDCSVVAWGTLANGDAFEGEAVKVAGVVTGSWEHVSPAVDDEENDDCGEDDGDGGRGRGHRMGRGRGHDNHRGRGRGHDRHGCGCDDGDDDDESGIPFTGEVDGLTCIFNGVRTAAVTGTGVYDGTPGYTFEAAIVDSGTGDSYDITIIAPDGTIAYSAGGNPATGEVEAVEL